MGSLMIFFCFQRLVFCILQTKIKRRAASDTSLASKHDNRFSDDIAFEDEIRICVEKRGTVTCLVLYLLYLHHTMHPCTFIHGEPVAVTYSELFYYQRFLLSFAMWERLAKSQILTAWISIFCIARPQLSYHAPASCRNEDSSQSWPSALWMKLSG